MTATFDSESELQQAFLQFRDEIDAYHDRRDRLIKTSRDVTSLSKKVIFHLHRFSMEHAWPTYDENGQLTQTPANGRLLVSANAKLHEIYDVIRTCAMKEELASETHKPSASMLRYERCIGMSLEELVEAASFLHFLEHNSLIHHEDIQQHLRTPDGHLIMYVSPMRYLLGLCDLNGELMRLAINAAACPDPMHVIERVLSMQRAIYDGTLKSFGREGKEMWLLSMSILTHATDTLQPWSH